MIGKAGPRFRITGTFVETFNTKENGSLLRWSFNIVGARCPDDRAPVIDGTATWSCAGSSALKR
jgi:hypothetical protein